MKKMYVLIVALLVSTISFAQGTINGSVKDSSNGVPLPGASVLVKGTSNGVTADFDGNFTITANNGDVLVISYLGFQSIEVAAKNGMSISLDSSTTQLDEIILTSGVIDLAKVRKTPVAVSTIQASEIALKVGNMEFPEVMNKTPGVYATKQGGGYGDSRISLRGFDQTNTAFLINGQPVNDMENGALYWSNWQGLTDIASGIQIQRGLGATKLAVPSVGGTISIFTKAADKKEGGTAAQLFGNDGYSKSTLSYNTGKNENGWATSMLLSKWQGDGYVYDTAGAGWTYFFAVGYSPEGSNHDFNFSFLGAAQWHHQRSSLVSIRDYQNFGEDGIDRRWNSDGGTLNGEEFNMRRNFYNKPLATFNWDYKISDNVKLASSFYGSAGRGGGTGPRGNNFRNSTSDITPFRKDLTEHYLENGRGARNADGFIDYDAVVAHNRTAAKPYTGAISGFKGQLLGSNGFRNDGVSREVLVRRASMNSHDWVGAISNLEINSGKMKYSIGVDLRSYTGYHYRVMNDLMGLDGYYSTGNRNSAGQIINTVVEASPFKNTGLNNGAKIDYFNIGNVGWQGFNGMAEYGGDKLTAVVQFGLSNQSFQREDLFDQPANPNSDTSNVAGGYFKGGANLNINEKSNIFFNAGMISRQPQFDAVFPNFGNDINSNIENEEINSLEFGYGYTSSKLDFNINLYATSWGNRFQSVGFQSNDGLDRTAQFRGIDVQHNGFEFEGTYRASNRLTLKGMLSIGDWKYTKDFDGELFDENQKPIGDVSLYTKDAKVGDAAQFTSFLEADYRLGKFNVDIGYRFVDGLYADYNIAANDSEFLKQNNKGALQLPSYGLVDLGVTFQIGKGLSLRTNINNLFNTEYIAEADSNIHAESGATTWNGVDTRNFVWFGFGTTWNTSLKYRF
jgi:outer membrane receptor protein involved in Fe transport